MTGQKLINWIVEHNAQDMQCVVQYRDGGGLYSGGDIPEFPILASYKGCDIPYDDDVKINYDTDEPNCFVL
jgi:hypothetical protein